MVFETIGLNENISFEETESNGIIPDDTDPLKFKQASRSFLLEVDQFTRIRFTASAVSFVYQGVVQPIYKASRLFYVQSDPRDWDVVERLSEWQIEGLKIDFISSNNRHSEARFNRLMFATHNTLVFNYFDSPDQSTGVVSNIGMSTDSDTFPILIPREGHFRWSSLPPDREGLRALLISGDTAALKGAKFSFSLDRPLPVVPDPIQGFIDSLKTD